MNHTSGRSRVSVLVVLMALLVTATARAQVPTNGLTFWVRADLGVQTSGGFVTNWVNQAPSGINNAAQTIASQQPTLVNNVLNGLPVVRFDPNDLLRTATPVQTNQTFHMFAVAPMGTNQISGGNGFVGPFHNGIDSATGYGFRRQGQNNYGLAFPNVAFVNFGPTNGLNFQLQEGARRPSGLVSYWANGKLSGTATPGAPIVPTGNSQVGGNDFGFFMNDVAEVLVYNDELSPLDRATVEEYLFAKYSIPEPSAILLAVAGVLLLVRRRRS